MEMPHKKEAARRIAGMFAKNLFILTLCSRKETTEEKGTFLLCRTPHVRRTFGIAHLIHTRLHNEIAIYKSH